jgi:hypothetical protein
MTKKEQSQEQQPRDTYQKPAWKKQGLLEEYATPNQHWPGSTGCSVFTPTTPQSGC